jgi:hypothetical protein
MAVHTELTPFEAADRLALRELFDTYAFCTDRRHGAGKKAFFTGGHQPSPSTSMLDSATQPRRSSPI